MTARILLLFAIFFTSFFCEAQDKKIVKYYDSLWVKTSKGSAFYFREIIKQDTLYNVYSYWMNSKKLYGKSVYSDNDLYNPRGCHISYYETGALKDSVNFYDDGKTKNAIHYHPNGKIFANYSFDKNSDKIISEGFDEEGGTIKNFMYEKEAEFIGGNKSWKNFMYRNLDPRIAMKNGASIGLYKVIIKFAVETDGRVVNIDAITDNGYGMEREVMRFISKSPKWNPAIHLGKTVKSYRRLPINFMVN